MAKDFELEAKVFKAFCDPNRLKILDILKTGEHCACKLLEILDVSQSTLSHHMKILTDAKIVNIRKDGKWSHYSLSSDGIEKVIEYFKKLSSINYSLFYKATIIVAKIKIYKSIYIDTRRNYGRNLVVFPKSNFRNALAK